ncbi:MAG: DUF5320 family protein [Candidatus Gracilibacteria bacterium]|jgi:hypothetical protein
MPNFDKSGPVGKGPVTGCGRGSCSGGQQSDARGCGQGVGRGMRCCGRGFSGKNSVSVENQKKQ